MKVQLAKRRQAKIKMALQGSSGSGKTMGALLIAYGLCGDWSKIVVIDTENYSASLYAHLGKFSVVNIAAPFSPEKYIEAIRLGEDAGFKVIIIDSISHEWEGIGGILETHASMQGNSFTNWGKLTPRHNSFVQAILQSQVHIIGTIRSKQEYVISEKNGRQVPEKIGLKGVTRDGMDYEFTIVLEVDIKHNAYSSKDRTGLFMDKPEFKITPEVGEKILAWCNEGVATEPETEDFISQINNCTNYDDLKRLYMANPRYQQSHHSHFTRRKNELMPNNFVNPKYNGNGNGSIQK